MAVKLARTWTDVVSEEGGMRTSSIVTALLILSALLAATGAQAAFPNFIPYSGRLSDGVGLTDDSRLDLRFTIYTCPCLATEAGCAEPCPADAPSGAVFRVTFQGDESVPVSAGYFSVKLGDGQVWDESVGWVAGNLTTLFASHDTLWLEITIAPGTDDERVLAPRQRVTATPYALHARTAEKAAGDLEARLAALEARVTAVESFLPIGTIVAWHRDLVEEAPPDLPEGWMRCDGQLVEDLESPFEGRLLPDLNGEGRFLRGSDHSGDVQSDSFKSHSHVSGAIYNVTDYAYGYTTFSGYYDGPAVSNPYTQSKHSPYTGSVGGDETRPKNMSVIWIIRVK